MAAKTILVTGISGFIAKHCAIELLRHGYLVRGTLRSLNKADEVRATLAKHCDCAGLEFAEADLLADRGWDAAMQGIDGVLHLASPFPLAEPKDPDELLRPAIDGTLRVLKAAVAARVPRVVQTSSMAAVAYGHPRSRTAPFTEDDWTVAEAPGVGAYTRSKTLAERAARDFIASTHPALHFSTINPGLVLGPLLDRDIGTSGETFRMFLRGKYPACPKLAFAVVDVRDVAKMHRLALESDAPSGGRYLAASGMAWFVDMMRPVKAQLGSKARRVPTTELPNFVVRLFALFDPASRLVLPELGRLFAIDNRRTRVALGITFSPVEESAPAMAQSLIDLDLV